MKPLGKRTFWSVSLIALACGMGFLGYEAGVVHAETTDLTLE